VLVLEPDARWVAEYYPVDEVVEADGGRLRVLLRYADPTWLVRLVLGLGGGARLVEPAELVAAVAARARAALADTVDPDHDDDHGDPGGERG
jgi:proteasome accessory factor C